VGEGMLRTLCSTLHRLRSRGIRASVPTSVHASEGAWALQTARLLATVTVPTLALLLDSQLWVLLSRLLWV
jgi:hypothetical protein